MDALCVVGALLWWWCVRGAAGSGSGSGSARAVRVETPSGAVLGRRRTEAYALGKGESIRTFSP